MSQQSWSHAEVMEVPLKASGIQFMLEGYGRWHLVLVKSSKHSNRYVWSERRDWDQKYATQSFPWPSLDLDFHWKVMSTLKLKLPNSLHLMLSGNTFLLCLLGDFKSQMLAIPWRLVITDLKEKHHNFQVEWQENKMSTC